jgi:galacturonosyltransferase
MRILILANNDVGLYKFRKALIDELLKDNEVFISLPYGPLVDPLVKAGCTFINTQMERRGMNPVKDLKLFHLYRSMMKQVQPDLVITYTIKPNIYGGLACRMAPVPYAVNITGLGTAFQGNGTLRHLVTKMYRASLKKVKVVFFENSANQELFVNERIVPADKTYLLPGAGVDLEYFSYMEYPQNESFRFLFIGRVMKEKGIDELLSAMRRLIADGEQCCLDIVGPCEEDYKEILAQCESEGWLEYHGYQEDVRPFIQDCDCFVLPSWHEGMANTNLECAASGRPVITSDIPGCREAVIRGASGYLCASKDKESLYNTMNMMLRNPAETRSLIGKTGRIHMETEFDKRLVVKKTIQTILEGLQ